MSEDSFTIELMYDSANFSTLELPDGVRTVGHLKAYKDIEGSNVTTNVGGVERSDDYVIPSGSYVAIVTTNKVGG
jgi:hypothetical protein|tara:strand:- start:1305 stop:1529 length:225 start_codon:yes stop_codon:yes gene_type:complete